MRRVIETGIANDTHVGVDAIAAFTGKSHRQTHRALQNPVFKFGSIWQMRKSRCIEFVAEQEARP